MPANKKVKITITKNADGTHRVLVDPAAKFLKKMGEQVVWTSQEADLSVNFNKNGCPFASSAFFGPVGTELCATGEPVNTTERSYAYSITVTPNPPLSKGKLGNLDPITVDPEVIITDSGPPGGGKKKKAAKKKKK